jgi:CBS domain-containing protein
MTSVAQVIKNKAVQSIFTISPNATVLEAIKIMADKGVGALTTKSIFTLFSSAKSLRKSSFLLIHSSLYSLIYF